MYLLILLNIFSGSEFSSAKSAKKVSSLHSIIMTTKDSSSVIIFLSFKPPVDLPNLYALSRSEAHIEENMDLSNGVSKLSVIKLPSL